MAKWWSPAVARVYGRQLLCLVLHWNINSWHTFYIFIGMRDHLLLVFAENHEYGVRAPLSWKKNWRKHRYSTRKMTVLINRVNFTYLTCIFDGLSARGGCLQARAIASQSPLRMKGAHIPILLFPFFIPLFPFHKSVDALPQPGAFFATSAVHNRSANHRGSKADRETLAAAGTVGWLVSGACDLTFSSARKTH